MSQVQVCVRVRPLSDIELQQEHGSIIQLPPNPKGSLFLQKPVKYLSIAEQQDKIRKRDVGSTFSFDRVFDSSNTHSPSYATQDDVFDYIGKKVVDTAFNAFNCTVFAYGQTGSGKTFTLMGSHNEGSQDRGIVPRTCEHLFREIMQRNEQSPDDAFSRYKVEISFLEIYNEKVRDLLLRQSSHPIDTDARPSSTKKAKTTLRVREHPKEGVIVEGLSRHIVNDYEAVEDLIKKGNAIRISGATHMHEHSSRSHAIFTIHFVQAEMSDDGIPSEKVSKINLVDLAGSERADPASDYNRERFKEGININQSLVSLGNVIDSLAELSQQSSSRPNTVASTRSGANQQPSIHIPYRTSILTFLLRDSLGGNAFTTMIATISPSSSSYNETVSTLRYASRTQVIKNQPVKNEDPQIRLIKDLKKEVDRLKKMLGNKGALGSVSQVLEQKVTQGQEEIDNLTQQWAAQWDRQKLLLQDSVTHDTTGLTVNSDFPHLVGFPNATSRNKAFVVYQLCDGSFTIGSGDHEIGVFGTPSDEIQGVIKNENGVVTLIPFKPNQFQINSIEISGKAVLYSGCLVQLGPSNIFRYWDPKVHKPSTANKDDYKQDGAMTEPSMGDGLNMEEDCSRLQFPEFTRLRGLDRAASVMSFQSVDMEDSVYDLKGRNSEKTQSMASLLSNQEVLEKMALADSLAEKLNEANQTIQSLQEARQHKDAEEEEKRIALEDLQFNYQEQICEHQDKIEELLRNSEAATEKAEAEISHLQQKYDEKMRKEKASLDEEIMKVDKLMNQIYAKKKTAKTTMARCNLEKEEIEIMGKLKNLKEREKKMKESLRSIENQIREKEKKLAAKKKKFEEKLLKMETELHSIKAQYLDRHMKTWSSNRPTSVGNLNRSNGNLFGASNLIQEDASETNIEDEELNLDGQAEKTMEVEGEVVKLRSKPGRITADKKAVMSAQGVSPNKPTFSQLLERRRKEREAAGEKFGNLDKRKQQSSNMINIAIGEDDEGKPMYLKISLKGSGEHLLDDPEQSSVSHKDQKSPSNRSRSLAKERALSMDLADLCKLTTFQEITLKEPQRYESGDNLLTELPSESGRNIMLQRFMNDLGRASVSDLRSNFGYSQEKLAPSTSETNLRIERHCEAGVQVVSPSSSCDTLFLENALKAKVVYHEVKLKVESHLHIREPLNITNGVRVGGARTNKRSVSDYESISTATRATSSTTQISGDSVMGTKIIEDDKKVMRRVINGPNAFRPVSQNITAYPVPPENYARRPRPKSMNLEPEFNEENQENEWGFSPIVRSSSGAIRKPFEIKQTEGHTARIGPKVMLTVTPPVTVTAIPGHMLSERPHLIPKSSSNSQTPSGSSKFLKMRRDLQSRQKPKAEISNSSIRSDPRAFSVISSREDLREANSMQLKQRLYSNQPFLAESAISNDSHGEPEARQNSTAQRTVLTTRTFNVDKTASRENDLEVAQYTEETSTSGSNQVRRRLNPNKTKMFEEKRMSWPVNKQEKLTAEMESQPLFIKDYYTSEDSVFKAGSEYAAYEGLFDPENIPEQTENSSTCEEAEPIYYLDKHQKMSKFKNSETTEEAVFRQNVVTRDPPMVYKMPNYDSRGTETEEVLEDENYSMGIYIETKSLAQSSLEIEPDSSNQPRPRPSHLTADYFKFPSPTRIRSSSFNRFSSNRDVSKISRVPSDALSNSKSYLASESGAYRHVEETFTTESIVTKGQEKRTKSGRILGKWKLVKKKEKNLKERENYLSTIEVPLNVPQSTPKKIKFDKALSTSAISINSLKKMRNQGSSPIEFLQENKKLHSQSMMFREERQRRQEGHSKLKLKHAKSLSRSKLQSESFNKYPESPKTPSSSIATQTACEISTQTPTSFESKSPKLKVSGMSTRTFEHRTAKTHSSSQHLHSSKVGQSRSSLRGGMRTAQYKVKGIKRVSDFDEKDFSSSESIRRKRLKNDARRPVRSKLNADFTEKSTKNKNRKYKRRKKHSGSSNSSSPITSDCEPKRSWGHHAKRKLKDAMTNTVNEIGIQTEENLSRGTNTCLEMETQTIQQFNSEVQCDAQLISSTVLTLREKIPSCESVQTFTFKSSPAVYIGNQDISNVVTLERPVSLENFLSAGSSDRKRYSANRKISSNPINEAKRKVFEFMKSCPANKVEEYLQLLHSAGVPGATLQKFLTALQKSQPLEIPTEVMQYFETSSMGTEDQFTDRAEPIVEKRNPIESLMNLLTFAPFPTSLHIAGNFLKGVYDISEQDKNKILDGILKQDPHCLPSDIDEKHYIALANAIGSGSGCNDDIILDTDTTSVLESENVSNLEMKSRRSSNALSQWSPFGSLTIPDIDKDIQNGKPGDLQTLKNESSCTEAKPKVGSLGRSVGTNCSLDTPNIKFPELIFDELCIGSRPLSRCLTLSPYETSRNNESPIANSESGPSSGHRHQSEEIGAGDYNEQLPLGRNKQIAASALGFKPHLRSSTPRGSAPPSVAPNQSGTFSSRSTSSNVPSMATQSFDENELNRQIPGNAIASKDFNQIESSPFRRIASVPNKEKIQEERDLEDDLKVDDSATLQSIPHGFLKSSKIEIVQHESIQLQNNAGKYFEIPLNLRDTVASQILINLNPETRRQLLTSAGAVPNNVVMVEKVVQKGNHEEICEAVATLIGDSTVEFVLQQAGNEECKRAVSQIIAIQNTTNDDITCETASATAFSDEPRSEESITQIFNPSKAIEIHGLITVASKILITLNKAERNYWLDRLGLYDVVKNEIKEAIEQGDIEKLKRVLPEDSAKFLIENFHPIKIKEGISAILKESNNLLAEKLEDVVIQTLLDNPPDMVIEMLSTTSTDPCAEKAIVQAVGNRDSAKLKLLLSNEIIETFVAEMSSDILIETLSFNTAKQNASPRNALEVTADDSDLSGLESNFSSSIKKISMLTTQARLGGNQDESPNLNKLRKFSPDYLQPAKVDKQLDTKSSKYLKAAGNGSNSEKPKRTESIDLEKKRNLHGTNDQLSKKPNQAEVLNPAIDIFLKAQPREPAVKNQSNSSPDTPGKDTLNNMNYVARVTKTLQEPDQKSDKAKNTFFSKNQANNPNLISVDGVSCNSDKQSEREDDNRTNIEKNGTISGDPTRGNKKLKKEVAMRKQPSDLSKQFPLKNRQKLLLHQEMLLQDPEIVSEPPMYATTKSNSGSYPIINSKKYSEGETAPNDEFACPFLADLSNYSEIETLDPTIRKVSKTKYLLRDTQIREQSVQIQMSSSPFGNIAQSTIPNQNNKDLTCPNEETWLRKPSGVEDGSAPFLLNQEDAYPSAEVTGPKTSAKESPQNQMKGPLNYNQTLEPHFKKLLEPRPPKKIFVKLPPWDRKRFDPNNGDIEVLETEKCIFAAGVPELVNNLNDLSALNIVEKFEPLAKPEDTSTKTFEVIAFGLESEQSKREPVSLTPQKIIASVILDLEGEDILGLISDLEPEMQNDILDAVIGKDVEKIAKLTDEQTANEMLGSIDPFEMANVIDKAEERFAQPEKLLKPKKIDDTNDFLMNLVRAYQTDLAVLKDILARLDVDVAKKIYEALAEGDLIAAKALLYSANVEEMPALNKIHAFSDSALVRQTPSKKLFNSLSKSESELARKPEGDKSISKEVLGEFYDQAQNVTGSDAKVVYVDIPVPENSQKVPSGDQLVDDGYNEGADLEIPQELIDILSKYVPPEQVFDLYNDFLHSPDSVAERFEREVVESLFNDVEAFEVEEQEKTNAVFNIAANTLQSLSEQDEMDDLVDKLHQLIPDIVSTFCEFLGRGDFIEAARFLPTEILEEMMEERRHNLSYTNDTQAVDDSSYASSKRTVPVIEEEEIEEDESTYENVKAFGILKKDEQSNSLKNLQVKFNPQVYEFDVTNPSVLETNESSSKESSFLGEGESPSTDCPNDTFGKHPSSVDEALYNLSNKSDLQDLTEKIAALEAKMDTIEIKESFEVEQEEPWYEVLLRSIGPPEEKFVVEIKGKPKTPPEKVEDIVMKGNGMDVEASAEEVEIDWEAFLEEMQRLDNCYPNSNNRTDRLSEKSDFDQVNWEILKWEQEQDRELETYENKSKVLGAGKNGESKAVAPPPNPYLEVNSVNTAWQQTRSPVSEQGLGQVKQQTEDAQNVDSRSLYRSSPMSHEEPDYIKQQNDDLPESTRTLLSSDFIPDNQEEDLKRDNAIPLENSPSSYFDSLSASQFSELERTSSFNLKGKAPLEKFQAMNSNEEPIESQIFEKIVSSGSETPQAKSGRLETVKREPKHSLKPEPGHEGIKPKTVEERAKNVLQKHETLPCIVDKNDKALEAELDFQLEASSCTVQNEHVINGTESLEGIADEGQIRPGNDEELHENPQMCDDEPENIPKFPEENVKHEEDTPAAYKEKLSRIVQPSVAAKYSNRASDALVEPPKECLKDAISGLASTEENELKYVLEPMLASQEPNESDQNRSFSLKKGEKIDAPKKNKKEAMPCEDEPIGEGYLFQNSSNEVLKPKGPNFINTIELRELLQDIWPQSEPVPLDDEGYIEVKEIFVQVVAISKPENVDSKPFNAAVSLTQDSANSPFKAALYSGSLTDGQQIHPTELELLVDASSPKYAETEGRAPGDGPNTEELTPSKTYKKDDKEKQIEPLESSEPDLNNTGMPRMFPKFQEKEQNKKSEKLKTPIEEEPVAKENAKISEKEPSVGFSPKTLEDEIMPSKRYLKITPYLIADPSKDKREIPEALNTNLLDEERKTPKPLEPEGEFKKEMAPISSRVLPGLQSEHLKRIGSDPAASYVKGEILPGTKHSHVNEELLKEYTKEPEDNSKINNPNANIYKVELKSNNFPKLDYSRSRMITPATKKSPKTLKMTLKEDNIKASKRLLPQIPIAETEDHSEQKANSEQDPPGNTRDSMDPTDRKISDQPKALKNSDQNFSERIGSKQHDPVERIEPGHERPKTIVGDNFMGDIEDEGNEMREGNRSGKDDDDDEYFFISLPSDCDDETLDQIQQYLLQPETLWKLINGETPVIEVGEDVDIDKLLTSEDDNESIGDINDLDDTNYLNELGADVENIFNIIEAALQPLSLEDEKFALDLESELETRKESPKKQMERTRFTTDENNNALQVYQDRNVPSAHHDRVLIPLPTDMFTTQLNISIDVKVNSSEDLSSSEHVQKSGYNSCQLPSSEKTHSLNRSSNLKNQGENQRKTTETQTISLSDQHNELLEAISDEHIDMIEYNFLPGVRTDKSVEELELMCSKTVGEVNGLLNIADQISPPGSPVGTYQTPKYQTNLLPQMAASSKENLAVNLKQPVNKTGLDGYPYGYKTTRQPGPFSNLINTVHRSPNSTVIKYREILQSGNEIDKNPIEQSKQFVPLEEICDSKIVPPIEQSVIPFKNGLNITYRSDAVFSLEKSSSEMLLDDEMLHEINSPIFPHLNNTVPLNANFPVTTGSEFENRPKSVERDINPLHRINDGTNAHISTNYVNSQSLFSTKYFKIPLPNRNVISAESQQLLKWKSHYNLSQSRAMKNSFCKKNLAPHGQCSSSSGYFQSDINLLDKQLSDLWPESGSDSFSSDNFSIENIKYEPKRKTTPVDNYPRVSLTYARRPEGPNVNFSKPLQSHAAVTKTGKPDDNLCTYLSGMTSYNPNMYRPTATFCNPKQGVHLCHQINRPTAHNARHRPLSIPDNESCEHGSAQCPLCVAEDADQACTCYSHGAECPLCVAECPQPECTCSESQSVYSPCIICEFELTA